MTGFSEDGIETNEHPARFAQIVAALSLFVAFYLATFFVGRFVSELAGAFLNQWVALISVCAATFATVAIFEHGEWNLGLFVPPRIAAREFLIGCAAAILLIGAADGLVLLTTRLHHVAGNGFPWIELIAVYLPAVFHEELLFRGYPFQKIWKSHRIAAILFSSFVFAALHAGNNAFSMLATMRRILMDSTPGKSRRLVFGAISRSGSLSVCWTICLMASSNDVDFMQWENYVG